MVLVILKFEFRICLEFGNWDLGFPPATLGGGGLMLLVIDVGNTNTVLGVYEEEVLVDHWRIGTEREKTADEWGILFRDLFLFDKIDIRDFKGIIISSVVPPVLDMLQGMA